MRVPRLGAALAALAVASFGGTFTAASAQGAAARADTSAFVGYETFRSATLSPDGKFVAGILRDKDGDLLIIHDRTTRVTKPIQRARKDQNLELTFVQFKGADRLIFGLQQKFEIVEGKASSNPFMTRPATRASPPMCRLRSKNCCRKIRNISCC